jgi:hypothetical protein
MTNDKNTFCQLSHPAPVSPFENFRMPIMNPSANNTKPSLCLIRRVPEIVSRIDILITILDLNPEDKLGEFLLDLHYSIQRLYVRKQDDVTQICQELIQS